MYHAHRTELLSADRDDLPDLVDSIVEKYRGDVGSLNMAGLSLGQSAPTPGPSRLPYIGVPRSTSRMALDIGRPVIDCPDWSPEGQSTITLYIGEVEKPLSGRGNRWIYNLGKSKSCDKLVALPNPKVDPKPYDSAMRSVGQLAEALSPGTNLLLRPARQADLAHFLAPLTHEGKDAPDFIPSTSTTPLPLSELIAARKVIIPAALVILCSNASLREASSIEAGDGSGGEESEKSDDEDELVDKALIASQLHSLVSLWPDGNPPRAALRRVNESLMSIQR
jgi:tRNA A64-2'-O-ribosylphosphate transferase